MKRLRGGERLESCQGQNGKKSHMGSGFNDDKDRYIRFRAKVCLHALILYRILNL